MDLDSFDSFDVPSEPVVLDARQLLEKKLHEYASMHGTTRVLKKPLINRYFFFNKSRVWFIDAGKVNKAAAIKFGKQVQKQLKSRRATPIDVPYLHYMPLYVGYGKDYVELPPLIARAAFEIQLLDEVAEALDACGAHELATVVDKRAHQMLGAAVEPED